MKKIEWKDPVFHEEHIESPSLLCDNSLLADFWLELLEEKGVQHEDIEKIKELIAEHDENLADYNREIAEKEHIKQMEKDEVDKNRYES